MSIVERIKKIEELDTNLKGGASEEQIIRAEKRLELKFPEEYKDYVKEFGAISFLGNEWTGLNVDGYLNVVNMTEEERALNEFFQYDKKELICNSLSEYLDICLEEN